MLISAPSEHQNLQARMVIRKRLLAATLLSLLAFAMDCQNLEFAEAELQMKVINCSLCVKNIFIMSVFISYDHIFFSLVCNVETFSLGLC